MKKQNFKILFAILLLPSLAFSQSLEIKKTEITVSKEAKKKGMFVSSSLNDQGLINSYIAYDLKKNELGFDVISVDKNGALVSMNTEIASDESAEKYGVNIPKPGVVANPAQGKKVLRLITANGVLGKMKIEEGYFEPRYRTNQDNLGNVIVYTKVLRGYKFVGNKTIDSDTRINIFATHGTPENSIERNYNVIEGLIPTTAGYLPLEGEIAFLGKNPSVDKNSPNAHNVITTGKFDGKTKAFVNMKEHVLDYNLGLVTSGYTQDGNRSVLVSTLNAPTTISAHKQWQADGNPYMSFLSFNTNGDVVDNITFKSASVRGNFGVVSNKDAHFVIGSINDGHDGYYRFDVGKATHFQIVKIQGGKVAAQNLFDVEKVTTDLLKNPEGKKGKLSYKDIAFDQYQILDNGDILAFASTPSSNFIFHFDTDANLKACYNVGRVDGKDFFRAGIQTLKSGTDLYVLYREQAPGMTLGFAKGLEGYGLMKKVNFDRVEELMTYGRVVKIDTKGLTCSKAVDINQEVILGETPMFLGNNQELLMLIRDSKDNYKMAIIK